MMLHTHSAGPWSDASGVAAVLQTESCQTLSATMGRVDAVKAITGALAPSAAPTAVPARRSGHVQRSEHNPRIVFPLLLAALRPLVRPLADSVQRLVGRGFGPRVTRILSGKGGNHCCGSLGSAFTCRRVSHPDRAQLSSLVSTSNHRSSSACLSPQFFFAAALTGAAMCLCPRTKQLCWPR